MCVGGQKIIKINILKTCYESNIIHSILNENYKHLRIFRLSSL